MDQMRMLAVVVWFAFGCGTGDSAKSAAEPGSQADPASVPPSTPEPPRREAEAKQVAIAGDPCDGGEVMGDPCDGGEVAQGVIGSRGGSGQGYGAGVGTLSNSRSRGPQMVIGKISILAGTPDDQLKRVIKRHAPQLKFCYEKLLQRDPKATFQVDAKFTFGADGKVTGASAVAGNAELESCLVTAMKRMVFPAPPGGGTVEVSYPFRFSPPAP